MVSDSRFTSGTFDFDCGCLIIEDEDGSNVELIVGDGANDMLDGGGKALGVRTWFKRSRGDLRSFHLSASHL
jgi:hypothetical protein